VRRDGEIELFTEEVPRSSKTLSGSGPRSTELRVSTPTLEDLFLKLTGHALHSLNRT
jgi:ABC-2 type transport system ATP-binding protein